MTTYTNTIGRSQLTGAARVYYADRIRNEQRSNAIIHRFVRDERDPAQEAAHTCTYTRVYDVATQIAALTELSDTIPHGWLDSDTFSITTGEYAWALRSTRILNLETFWAGGLDPVIRDRVARNYVDTAERQALNAYLTCEASYTDYRHYGSPDSSATSRITLASTDIANTDMVDAAKIALEGRDVSTAFTGPGAGIYMLCHPFVLADVVREDASYITAAYYQGAQRLLQGFQQPLWNGVVPVTSTKMILKNAGLYTDGTQTGLTAAANGASTAGGVSTIAVTSSAGFAAGDIIAVHPVADGHNVLLTSTTLEYGKVASVPGGGVSLVLERPLTIDHASGAYVTKSHDLFPVIFVGADFEGGETVVRGITLDVNLFAVNNPQSIGDPVGRFSAVAWYGVYGYDLISPWNMELYILRTSQTAVTRRPL